MIPHNVAHYAAALHISAAFVDLKGCDFMAASYLMGARDGEGKKSGKWYGMISLLTKNGFGNWCIMDVFCETRDVYDNITADCSIGDPVEVTVNLQGHLIECIPHDSFPRLDLCAD